MNETKPKDRWDKVQICCTAIAAVGLPVVGLLYTWQTRVADGNRLKQQARLERASREADRATTLATLFVSKEPEKQRFALALARAFEREEVLPHEIILVFETVASDPETKTAPDIKTETDKLAIELSDRSKTPEVREAATRAIEKLTPSTGKPNRMYIDISDGQQSKADKITTALLRLGFSTYQIEAHTHWNAPRQTEVHYRDQADFDNGNVRRIQSLLQNQFKLTSVPVSDVDKLLISHNPGHFEIHLAKD